VHGATRTLQVGEQILVSGAGIEARNTIEPNSDEWDWASNAAPVFDIDGRPANEFLAWAGRETGLKVVFATPQSEAEAQRAVLSGSIAGLAPDEALAAVLPTTSLRSTERDGQLFEFLGKLVRPDPALAFPSIVRAAPLDFALGVLWLALLAALLFMGKGVWARARGTPP
jgi:hypothetical protein